jgi:23S rRNA pseudouridine1911/1915/1917 synthase
MMNLPELARGKRFDHAIHEALSGAGRASSIREVREAMKDGRIRVDGRSRKPGDRAKGGEEIGLERFTPKREAVVEAEPELGAKVLFEDAHLLALDKPSGMAVAPLEAGEKGTLLAAAIARAPQIASAGPPLEGGLSHRLDVDTSGIVLFAKDEATRAGLRADFSAHRIEKRYLAIVIDRDRALADGHVIEGAIVNAGDHVRVAGAGEQQPKGALPASTRIAVKKELGGGRRLVEATTVTGRRHQVRAHLASAGAPIAGDRLYGGDASDAPRLALHACRILLADGRAIESPLPGDLAALVGKG